MDAIPPSHPLARLFAGVTEQTFFTKLGVADPPLIDYVADLLCRFVHIDTPPGAQEYERQLGAMARAADALDQDDSARREMHRRVGDLALFWGGLYPEVLRRHPGPEPLRNVIAHGKRGYHVAGCIQLPECAAESPVLLRLSSQFELCLEGLREVRREFAGLSGGNSGAGLIG